MSRQWGKDGFEAGALAGEVYEDQMVPSLAAHLAQAMLRDVEVRMRVDAVATDMRRRLKGAIQAIAPGMIGTPDRRSVLESLGDQERAAVAAHVVEGAEGAMAVTDDDDRLAGNGDGHRRARLRKLVGYPDKDPA